MVIDMGNDFPASVQGYMDQLKCSVLVRDTPHRKTTRGRNIYGPGEYRSIFLDGTILIVSDFDYLTPKLQVVPEDLSVPLLGSKTFHLICSPKRAVSIIKGVLLRRQEHGITVRPMFLWEPVPGVCSPADWPDCIEAIKLVDIISPNVNEAFSFLGKTIEEEVPFNQFKSQVELITDEYLRHQMDGSGRAVVVRCGRYGCLVATNEMMRWLPAYHRNSEKVVDPTGGGNTFCGAFCIGWVREQRDLVKAAEYGNIAASFAIEQFGMPRLQYEHGAEKWNGDTLERRRTVYQAQVLS